MSFNILHHIYSTLFVLCIIVVFEIFFLLKKNRALKVILLVYTFAVLWYSAANIYCIYYGYNRFLLEAPFPILSICFITLFSTLCYNYICNYVIVFSVAIMIVYLSLLLYYIFIVPTHSSISLSGTNQLGDYFIYIKLALLSVFFLITVNLYVQMNKKYTGDKLYFKSIKNWSFIFLVSSVFIVIAGIIKGVIGYENLVSKYIMTSIFFITIISILFRPKLLNKSTLSISLDDFLNKKTDNSLTKAVFNQVFYIDLYFLNPEASMDDLSKKFGVSSENLYRFIYTNYNSGFNDLLNENRVNYFIEVVKSKKHDNYTIDALSQMAGFRSRHHLYKPFKKFHGGVPSDFLRSLD